MPDVPQIPHNGQIRKLDIADPGEIIVVRVVKKVVPNYSLQPKEALKVSKK